MEKVNHSEHGPILYAGKEWEYKMLDDIEELKTELDQDEAGGNHFARLLNEGEKINETIR